MKDVVEALRESHANTVMFSGGWIEETLHKRAADEIERLRQTVAELRGEA